MEIGRVWAKGMGQLGEAEIRPVTSWFKEDLELGFASLNLSMYLPPPSCLAHTLS